MESKGESTQKEVHDGGKDQKKSENPFSLYSPAILHQNLLMYLKNESIKHILIFRNIEGSIVTKASQPSILESAQQNIDENEDPEDP